MSQAGLSGLGFYVPAHRVPVREIGQAWGAGGRGEKAVCGPDEDVVTMGAAAAEAALVAANRRPEEVDMLYFCTTSSPYVEQTCAALVAEVLGLRSEAVLQDFGGSTRCGTGGLIACVQGLRAGAGKVGLVVVADNRPAAPGSALERTLGAGAAALVVEAERPAVVIEGWACYGRFFPDRWRATGEAFVRGDYDPRFVRRHGYTEHLARAVETLAERVGVGAGDFRRYFFPLADDRLPGEAAGRLGIPRERVATDTFPRFGDLGSASALLQLAFGAGEPGDRVVVAGYGSGLADALALRFVRALPVRPAPEGVDEGARRLSYAEYLRVQGLLATEGDYPLAVPPGSQTFWRGRGEILRLEAARCDRCGYVNFPPSTRTICIRCRHTGLSRVRLARTGRIHSFCINYYMPPGFESPLPYIVVDLDGGGRYQGMGTEFAGVRPEVGMPVELVLRRISRERGQSTYGYKVRPRVTAREG